MKSTFKFTIYVIIIIFLNTILIFSEELRVNKNYCNSSKSYIDECLNKTPNYSIHFEDWESYCNNRKLKKVTSMSCEDLNKEFFGD